MEPNFELGPRIGTFLIVTAFGFIVLFLGSEFSHEANFNYFFISLALLFIGILFHRRRKPPADSGRFGGIRRMRARSKQRQEDRLKKQQKKEPAKK